MDCCVPGSNCFEWIKVLSPTVVALVFGVIAARITWNQYQVAHAKLKLDLFERRYAIFMKVWGITSNIVHYGPALGRPDGLGIIGTPFNDIKPEAAFLFGKKIDTYIAELATKWAQYRAHEELSGEEASKNVENGIVLKNYFFEQANVGVKGQFASFLNFANWK
jgi:hypothetical protein